MDATVCHRRRLARLAPREQRPLQQLASSLYRGHVRRVHFNSWPPHCVAGTYGAQFRAGLDTGRFLLVLDKGTGNADDGYSAFEATSEDLESWLRGRGIEMLYVCGLATDYCVLQTVLDARRLGFGVTVLRDGIAAVEVNPGDGQRAQGVMEAAGARFTPSGQN